MASLIELLKQRNPLSLQYKNENNAALYDLVNNASNTPNPAQPDNKQLIQARQMDMVPPININKDENTVVPVDNNTDEIYSQYTKDILEPEKPKGFWGGLKNAIEKNPSLVPSLIGAVTAVTKGDPYIAGAMGEQGARMLQQETAGLAEQAKERRQGRKEYVERQIAQEGALQKAQQEAEKAYNIKGMELQQKAEEAARKGEEAEAQRALDEAKLKQEKELRLAEIAQKAQDTAKRMALAKLELQIQRGDKNINNISPETFDREDKLRKEYVKNLGTFPDVSEAYGRVVESASDPTAAGDLALIFNYMKILDPSSTVREGEFATAQNSGSIQNRIIAQYNNILEGERLSPQQRQDFVNRSTKLYKQAKLQSDNVKKQYSKLAKNYGVSKDRTIVDFSYIPKKIESNKTNQSNIQSTKNKVGRFKIVGVK